MVSTDVSSTSSFGAPSLCSRVTARGDAGTPIAVITKIIWSINPHNTVLLESADGTERIVWDDGIKRYLHQIISSGKPAWRTENIWLKRDAYDALKTDVKWVVPNLADHSDLAGPSTVVASDAPNMREIGQTDQVGPKNEDVESSLAHQHGILYSQPTRNPDAESQVHEELISATSVAAAAVTHTGCMVALVPSEHDINRIALPHGETKQDLHLTLGYYGDASLIPAEVQDGILEATVRAVDTMPTVVGDAFAISWFNPDGNEPCAVMIVGGSHVADVHRRVTNHVTDVFIQSGVEMFTQHSPWIPHITLQYTGDDTPDIKSLINGRLGPITFDRARVTFGDDVYDIPLGDTMRDNDDDDDNVDLDELIQYDDEGELIVPNMFIPMAAFRERDINAPGGAGHSLRDYWIYGKGAAKIRWGTEGSFKRCVKLLREYVRNPEGLCAEYHNEATGEYPRGGNVPSTGDTVTMDHTMIYDNDTDYGDVIAPQVEREESDNMADDNECPPGRHMMPDGTCMDDADMQSASWEGILTLEGAESGDGRMFASNALTWDDPPLPLMWQKETSHGGRTDVSVRVGSIDEITREPDPNGKAGVFLIKGKGTIDLGNEDGREVYRRMQRNYMRGNSVDVDSVKDSDVQFVYPMPTGDEAADMLQRPELTIFKRGRIRATTLVEIPAFTEARLTLTSSAELRSFRATPQHTTSVDDGPWDASTNLRRLPTPMPVVTANDVFAWIDPKFIKEDKIPKLAGKFPHHVVSPDGTPGAANLTACSGAIGALNGARGGTTIPESERQATYNHIASHMRDAEIDPPPLLSTSAYLEALAASATPEHTTDVVYGEWDSGANVKRLPSPMPIDDAQKMFAWIDDSMVEDGMMPKSAGKLPHHEVSADGTPGPANLTACSAAIGALNGARGGVDIPESERQATYDHLAAHIRDADREPPELLSMEDIELEALIAATSVITVSDTPPREWFNEPTDVMMTGALSVTNEGRVYGYIAPANVRHRSFQDRAQYVPMRKVDYTRFMGGETIVADGGRVATGNITMGCGHASTSHVMDADRAAEHYDNTCSIVATVRVGMNATGVWVAGALLPGTTPDQIRRMMACRLSGDWRPHLDKPGWREFVAALLVPVPGFPMERTGLTASVEDGVLVASTVGLQYVSGNDSVALVDNTGDIEDVDDDLDDASDTDDVGSDDVNDTDDAFTCTCDCNCPTDRNTDHDTAYATRSAEDIAVVPVSSASDDARSRTSAIRKRIMSARLARINTARARIAGKSKPDIVEPSALTIQDRMAALRARLNKG